MKTAEEKFAILAQYLSPDRPIRTEQFLKGRRKELAAVEEELRHFHSVPFVFGYRGVGKTSLARTAAQYVTPSDREHIYVPCSPQSGMLSIFREIGHEMLSLALRFGGIETTKKKLEINLSLRPGIKLSLENETPQLEEFRDVNEAVRTLREIEAIVPDANSTVVILDELEELRVEDRINLAYLIKQLGDQQFSSRFMLVGIAENVQELIGAHESVPRYIKEVCLDPLKPQDLMDIVSEAAQAVEVNISRDILVRIAIIGNGFPHFAHLMGKALLTEAVRTRATSIDSTLYSAGVAQAIQDSIQVLRIAYETATQRRDDIYKHLLWALADFDVVDVRTDEWKARYEQFATKKGWPLQSPDRVGNFITRLKSRDYGNVVRNTPITYGSRDTRYRYSRFADTLMKGHVRLQAELAGVRLGAQPGL